MQTVNQSKAELIDDLNTFSELGGKFHKLIHSKEPKSAPVSGLDEMTGLYWAAALGEVLAENN